MNKIQKTNTSFMLLISCIAAVFAGIAIVANTMAPQKSVAQIQVIEETTALKTEGFKLVRENKKIVEAFDNLYQNNRSTTLNLELDKLIYKKEKVETELSVIAEYLDDAHSSTQAELAISDLDNVKDKLNTYYNLLKEIIK